MKIHIPIFLFLFITSSLCHAQNITLWGCTIQGGTNSDGTILNYNVGTTLETDNYDFLGMPTDGALPITTLIRANNGLLYGLTSTGGAGGGTIFNYNISTGAETDLHDFSGGTDGDVPHYALIQANNGLLYGTTQDGGSGSAPGDGVIFSYDIATGTETVVYDFKGGTADGNNPLTSPFQASNGLIYGVTAAGGANGLGIIYSFDITTNTETDLYDFGSYSGDGEQPYCAFIEVDDSLLYGTTGIGGANHDGTIFKYNILTGNYTVVYSFSGGTDGADPEHFTLLNVGDSVLYGTTKTGGIYTNGTIFSYNLTSGIESVVHDFGNGTDGKNPYNSLIQASNGLLYGMTEQGGTYGSPIGYGIIYSYNIATGTETDLHDFGNGTDGRDPYGSLIEVDTATIYAAPVPAICSGGSVLLTASGSPTYAWAPSAGLSATTGDSVIASPTVTTTYTVVGTGAIPTYPTTVVVTVNPVPVTMVNTPQPVCNGTSAMLTASGAAAYTWAPIKNLSSATGSMVTATPTTTTTYTVIGTSGGCADTTTTVVTVKPTPNLNVPIPPTICNGSMATLTASGAATYTWSPTSGLSTTTGDTITANPTATTTYTVAGLGINGCADTITVTVTVNPGVVIGVNTPQPKCSGSIDTLTVTGATTYTWSPNTGLSATSGSTVTANPTVTTTYTITGTSSGCPGTTMVTVAIDSIPSLILNTPVSICTGTSAMLTASGATSYTWLPATGLNATTGSSVTATPTATTTYIVTGINSFGCTTTDTDIVTVIPAPNTPTITVSITGDSLISSATTDNQWYFNGQPITGATGPVLVIKGREHGWYTVTVTNPANGCSTTSDSTTSVNQLSVNSKQLSIYPNPVSNQLNITYNISQQGTLQIFDVLGREVMTLTLYPYFKSRIIDVTNLTAGMYELRLITGNREMVKKFVKE